MAEKNDDIKNLFLNLGLNPSDYHEIRTAPTANVTVSEAPRRWSLLQSAAAPAAVKPLASMSGLAAAGPAIKPAMPSPPAVMAAAEPAPEMSLATLSAALLGAAEDIVRAETAARPTAGQAAKPAAAVAPVAPAALPTALANALSQVNPVDGLQSLFQSVKEPQTVSVLPSADDRPTERCTDQLFDKGPAATSFADRVAALPPSFLSPASRVSNPSDEPATRHMPPPSRLGPLPSPAMMPPAAAAPAASGRLRFAKPAAEAAAGHGESLQDVFRRLARDNRS